MRPEYQSRNAAEALVLGQDQSARTVVPSPLPWSCTFLAMAEVIARRSKDPSTKVGAILVSPDRRELACGFNGFPSSILDYAAILNKEVTEPLSKYDVIVHAEMNAILNCVRRPEGWTLYCTHRPCITCAKHIIAAGVAHVFCYDRGPATDMGCDKAELLFELAKVSYQKVSP